MLPLVALPFLAPAYADSSKDVRDQVQQRRLEASEQASRHRDRRPNNPGSVIYRSGPDRDVDYGTLSRQIDSLGNIIADMKRKRQQQAVRPAGSWGPKLLPDAGHDPVTQVYGPRGVTLATVAALLDYRLSVRGNPRLKAGGVLDKGKAIEAKIVTQNGSLVEVYAVDKGTGLWQAVPPAPSTKKPARKSAKQPAKEQTKKSK